MKKRILSFILVFALLCSMSICASAASWNGNTSGGSRGTVTTSATLYVYSEHAVASTSSGAYDHGILATTVRFHYTNTLNQFATKTASGHASASAYPSDMKDIFSAISADSEHDVNGGSEWGSWHWELSATR